MKMGVRSHGADAFNDLSLYATSRQRVEVLGWKGILAENPPGPFGGSIALIQEGSIAVKN